MSRIACLIMAAGAGSRFGAIKQLALVEGVPLIRRALSTAMSVFAEDTFVVAGAHGREVRETLRPALPETHLIDSPEWRQGLGASIAAGVRHLTGEHDYDAVLIMLGDQAALKQQDLGALADRFTGSHIVAAQYHGRRGVPALFPARCFDALTALSGDSGAKHLLNDTAEDIVAVDMPRAAIDIDTPADLQRPAWTE